MGSVEDLCGHKVVELSPDKKGKPSSSPLSWVAVSLSEESFLPLPLDHLGSLSRTDPPTAGYIRDV